jgi:lipid II isoglutaminyl synthase (glutamine-hydrolysing)
VRPLRIGVLYPSLLNIYADRGNMLVLRARCHWRGIDVHVAGAEIGEPLDGDAYDIYYLGGGQDQDQRRCARDLLAHKRGALWAAADRGALVLGICGGYQLLGHGYRTGTDRLPGLGLLDLETVAGDGSRLTGNVAVRARLPGWGPQLVAGFENHAGRTLLGEATPLGRVVRGFGNNGDDDTEGAVGGPHANVIGTYLHGPLLAANPSLADWLIARALQVPLASLAPLDDALENASHTAARQAAGL